MKAAVYSRYGGPSVLSIEEVDKPIPKSNEVCVKIYATSINSADIDQLKGTAFGRMSGLLKPRYKVLGSDISGIVESIGSSVSRFKIGDPVYGDMTEEGFSTFAEYKTVREDALTLKPNNMSFVEAAALPSAGVIALQSINNQKSISKDDVVLINGVGGGMGSLALQIVKSLGAYVIGVDKGIKLDKAKALGADEVIDYENYDYTKLSKRYDRIIDCHAIHGPNKYFKLLKEDGVYYMIGGTIRSLIKTAIYGTIKSKNNNKKVLVLLGKPNKKEDLTLLEEYYKENMYQILIDKSFDFKDIREAVSYFLEGTFVGKVVIKICDYEESL